MGLVEFYEWGHVAAAHDCDEVEHAICVPARHDGLPFGFGH